MFLEKLIYLVRLCIIKEYLETNRQKANMIITIIGLIAGLIIVLDDKNIIDSEQNIFYILAIILYIGAINFFYILLKAYRQIKKRR